MLQLRSQLRIPDSTSRCIHKICQGCTFFNHYFVSFLKFDTVTKIHEHKPETSHRDRHVSIFFHPISLFCAWFASNASRHIFSSTRYRLFGELHTKAVNQTFPIHAVVTAKCWVPSVGQLFLLSNKSTGGYPVPLPCNLSHTLDNI